MALILLLAGACTLPHAYARRSRIRTTRSSVTPAGTAPLAPPSGVVAVFSAPGFPYYEGSPYLRPEVIAAELRSAGIEARVVGLPELADPARFNRRRFALLVHVYGNTFPLAAYQNLRRFHQDGGGIVSTGVPFTHPVAESPGGGWKDLGHTGQYLGRGGIGMGGFGGPEPGGTVTLALNNPLRFQRRDLPFSTGFQPQILDPTTLPAGDTVLPVLVAARGGRRLGYPAAMVVHRDAFRGAVDGWAGAYTPDDLQGAFFLRQTVERAAVAALLREQQLPVKQADQALARIAARPRPAPAPHDLPLPVEHRPYRTFFPVSPPVARHLFVADVRGLSPADRLLLTSLQGLVNRRQPRIYLIFSPQDRRWLDWMKREGDTGSEIQVADPMSLLARFRAEFRDAVIPDPALYIGADIAADLAGAGSLLIATPEQVKQYGLRVKADLRGRFRGDAQALSWVATTLYPRLSHFLMMVAHPDLAYNGSFDYMIQHRGIIFWITGAKDGVGPGRDPLAEQAVMERLFARMPVNIPVRGFWWHGGGVGMGEGPGVTFGSRFGKITVVSDGMSNISVHSGIHASWLLQRPHAAPPPLDRTRVYYAFTMSDGDNLDTHFNYFPAYVESPLHGQFPVGWGMGPSIIDLAPDVARWFYGRATPADEYVCDVSGVGYIYPASFATAYRSQQAVIDDFLGWTARYIRRMEQHAVRPMGEDTTQIARYARQIPGLECLIPDYGHVDRLPYPALTYMLPGGVPVFRAATNWGHGVDGVVAQIRETAGQRRPAFLNVFIWNWGFRMPDLQAIMQRLGPDYVAVTPYQLSLLYRQYRKPAAPALRANSATALQGGQHR